MKFKFYSLIVFFFSMTVSAQDFYISPVGSDKADGLAFDAGTEGSSGPFQTLEHAQQVIRELKKAGAFKEPVTVHIAAGVYQLRRPLEFDIRDTGFAGREIIWQGEKGASVISGGLALSGCGPSGGALWSCAVSGLNLDSLKYPNVTPKKGNIPGFDLFVDGKRLHLARWPDAEWAHIKTPLDEKTRFNSFEQLPTIGRDVAQAQVHIYPGSDWFDEYLPVKAVDAERNELSLAADTVYPLASGRRFYLQNIQTELNAPGEWFYDKPEARILFIPPDSETPKNMVVSFLQNLITVQGANFISFENLILRHGNGIAVSIKAADHLSFDRLEINNVEAGIEAVNSTNISVSNSQLHDIGGRGIYLEGGDRKTLKPSSNNIHNNHIHHFGTTFLSFSPGIETGGVGSLISHNLIEYSSGTGAAIKGNDHVFEKNEIQHVCELSSDCGAIYSGRNWSERGNIIRYNSIHDLYGYGLQSVDLEKNVVKYAAEGARGIFLDDGESGFKVFGNILNNAGTTPIILAGGRDTSIENNVIKSDGWAIFVDKRWPDYDWEANRKSLKAVPYQSAVWRAKYPELSIPMHNDTWPEGNTIKNNIIISAHADGGDSLKYILPAGSNTIEKNLVWSGLGDFKIEYNILDKNIIKNHMPWAEWVAEKIEQNSLNADPCLTIKGNTVIACKDTPIYKLGFQAIPNDIGYKKPN